MGCAAAEPITVRPEVSPYGATDLVVHPVQVDHQLLPVPRTVGVPTGTATGAAPKACRRSCRFPTRRGRSPLLAELYRRWSVDLDETATRDSAAEHKALLDTAQARDAELAVDLLATQIRTTHDGLSKNL
jgi:hypothetical protein